ncbi:MAG: PH domain-containing protein [Lachnospiraceae bacterium]|nr:PH domain-containing protein [Lachnospiraceae bacterium]
MWKARKRIWCGLPWTFTVYSFDDSRIFIDSGVLNKRQDEVRLYRVLDLSVTRSLIQRIFGMGTIHVSSSDKNMKDFDLINIKHVIDVKEDLSQRVEKQRDAKRVSTREFLDYDDDNDVDDEVEE